MTRRNTTRWQGGRYRGGPDFAGAVQGQRVGQPLECQLEFDAARFRILAERSESIGMAKDR